jgi:hypothetical protein
MSALTLINAAEATRTKGLARRLDKSSLALASTNASLQESGNTHSIDALHAYLTGFISCRIKLLKRFGPRLQKLECNAV